MYLDDDFIKGLAEDSREAIIAICKRYRRIWNSVKSGSDKYQLALEVYAFLQTFFSVRGLPLIEVNITGDLDGDTKNIDGFIRDLGKKTQAKIHVRTLDEYKHHYAIKFGTEFHYEFSEGDLQKIQGLLNKLRTLISDSQDLTEDHKSRLLKRLEALQSELHKRVSNLDRFWGFFIDASIVIGLMGENAKPMIEAVQKIVQIIWPTQTRAYELPSDLPFKLLGQAEDDKSE